LFVYSSISVWVKNCDELELPDTEKEDLDSFIDQMYEKLEDGTNHFIVHPELCNCKSTFFSSFRIKRLKVTLRTHSVLILKKLKKCTQSILLSNLFLDRQCPFYLLHDILITKNLKLAVLVK